ncbi:exonuclease [Pseudomonas sp. S10E 269]|uniref:3'-5' exonuclease n=1 Tax=unclassified Pseudomonas TaxID=196821 RepID=UPI000C26B2F1|nr:MULTISPECIES: 3'-5' exonuclease [unclassified Pseudomonas]PJK31761.1 exonuclease [Pseudomonas sp. S09F 262]PJK37557.1 exonuclease [Pseudomonas sp. S10E 269]
MEVKKPTRLAALQQWVSGARYLLCVDLEATCDDFPEGLIEHERDLYQLQVPRDEMETIEVGAVLIDLQAGGQLVGEFGSFVKPVLHPRLTTFCSQLTTIEQADIDGASGYVEVAGQLRAFLAPYVEEGVQWCSWGDYDRKQLLADAERLGCEAMLDPSAHASLKRWHAKVYACRAMGLKSAAGALGLQWLGTHHRGIDDARNLASVVQRMLTAA